MVNDGPILLHFHIVWFLCLQGRALSFIRELSRFRRDGITGGETRPVSFLNSSTWKREEKEREGETKSDVPLIFCGR